MGRIISGVPNYVIYIAGAGAIYYFFFYNQDEEKQGRKVRGI